MIALAIFVLIRKIKMAKEKESVFANVPDKPKELVMPTLVKTNVIKEKTLDEELEVDDKKSDIIYAIEWGSEEAELYTFNLPTFTGESLIVDEFFKKGILSESVLDHSVEEYFCEWPEENSIKLALSSGVFIQSYSMDNLDWINNKYEDAQTNLKDRVIEAYQKIMPNLISRINQLEGSRPQSNERQPQKPVQKPRSQLIEL